MLPTAAALAGAVLGWFVAPALNRMPGICFRAFNIGFDQATGQQYALAESGHAVPGAQRLRFPAQVERGARGSGGEQIEGPLRMLGVMFKRRGA